MNNITVQRTTPQKMQLVTEFKNIFKYEEVITDDKLKYLNNEYVDYINRNKDILFSINCEYDAPVEQCVLNYYNKYWGNKAFNDILEKYKLRYEWYDTCVVFIYKDNHDD